MNNRWHHDNTLVRKLRVRAEGLDPLAARLRAESLLSAAGVRPPGLGPAAIFCVRSLRTRRRLPRLAADRIVWERDLQAALTVLLRQAARPARAPVPANAEAVLFADQAEMLACLARDWLIGVVPAHWWWRSLLNGMAVDEMILSAWKDAPEHLPAALTHLAAWNLALPFVRRRLGTEAAGTFLCKVARAHAVGIDVGVQPSKADDATAIKNGAGEARSVERVPLPPWRRWVPEASASGLDVEQQCFLGVVLMLQRAPQVLRSAPFAGEVIRWRRELAPKMTEGAFTKRIPRFHTDEAEVPGLTETPTASAVELSHRERAVAPSDQFLYDPRAPVDGVALAPKANTTESDARPSDPRLDEGGVSIPRQESPMLRRAEPTSPRDVKAARTERGDLSNRPDLDINAEVSAQPRELVVDQGVAASPCADKPVAPSESPMLSFDVEATQTELGGLFYLINLGLFLDLYGDFTCPARPGLTLPIWDFVFLLGRRLLKDERTSDAVWDLLARLAGRDADTPPGHGFEPPEAWHLPADWLWPFAQADASGPGQSCIPAEADVCTSSPVAKSALDGFATQCLCNVCATAPPLPVKNAHTHAHTHAQTLQGQASQSVMACDCKPPLDRWLDWLLPYVRLRLGLALGLADADEVAELLLVHRARVETTATRLDVTLALADLPCAIRLAGLDRDPGWVPAAGRFVAFHYE